MRNYEIPFWWHVDGLKLVAFHRYTSHVTDAWMEVEASELKEKSPISWRWFKDLEKRVRESWIREVESTGKSYDRTDVWDNKIVIECETSQGNRVFVGYYDNRFFLGFGVRSDSWIVPARFIEDPKCVICKESIYTHHDLCPSKP